MSDRETMRLERALAADPSDAVALEALAAARTRAGRGWVDEPLPLDLRCSERERGVYVWTRHGLGLELVLVPEGGSRTVEIAGLPAILPVEPAFYVGRYPVTWGEWLRWPTRRIPTGVGADQADHPAVNITHADAVAFCAWAGLHLPTAAEWTRAAGLDRAPCHLPGDTNPHDPRHHSSCSICDGEGWLPGRPYPWGNEAPTPERCVSAWWAAKDHSATVETYDGPRPVRWVAPRATLPVRIPESRPARAEGASPCGAMDMVGHVWQWVGAPHPSPRPTRWVCGGSFRSGPLTEIHSWQRHSEVGSNPVLGVGRSLVEASDDVGFRVALSEPTA